METFRSVIYIACAVGIISAVVSMAAPNAGISRHLSLIVGAVMILAVASPFTDKRFKLSLPKPDEIDKATPEELTKLSESYYLSAAEIKVEEYFLERLRDSGYKKVYADIKAELDEYNYIVISSVTVYGAESSQRDALTELFREELPECEIIFDSGADSVGEDHEKSQEALRRGAEI